MSFENPGPKGERQVEQPTSPLEKALAHVEAGNLKAGLEAALENLLPHLEHIDLEKDGDPSNKEHEVDTLIEQAFDLLRAGDVRKIKNWITSMLAPHEDHDRQETPRGEATLAELTPEARREQLIDQLITNNPEIPDDVKVWTVELIGRFPDLLTHENMTDIKATYDEQDRYGASVRIQYMMDEGKVNRIFRKSHLKSS